MFIVEFTGSPFYRSAHYLEVDIVRLVQRSRKRATRFATREEATRAARGSWPNGFKAAVIEA